MTGRPHRLSLPLLLLAAACGSRAPPPSGGAQPSAAAGEPAPPSPRATPAAGAHPPGAPARATVPLPRCLARGRGAPAQLLVARAADAFDRDEPARALACAEEALRQAPRLLSALHYRAAALTALERLDEARLAYARALAVDPEDPDVLYGAADLYVARVPPDRPALELGLEYALRGARAARRRDPALASHLLTTAAMAENDLGRSADALEHAAEALRLAPRSGDALYEKGVSLYELCRFGEARAALEGVLARAPDDPWALHQLALVAERTGDAARAERLERRARALAPDEFPPPLEVDLRGFEGEIRRAVAALPDGERRALAAVPVEVVDLPAVDDLTAVDPPLSPSILGLYRGPPEGEACLPEDGPRCRSIVFYRRNLVRFARSRAELEEQVRVTLLHELGHLHGETDEDLRARGLE